MFITMWKTMFIIYPHMESFYIRLLTFLSFLQFLFLLRKFLFVKTYFFCISTVFVFFEHNHKMYFIQEPGLYLRLKGYFNPVFIYMVIFTTIYMIRI